jgi:hypothetical protein
MGAASTKYTRVHPVDVKTNGLKIGDVVWYRDGAFMVAGFADYGEVVQLHSVDDADGIVIFVRATSLVV